MNCNESQHFGVQTGVPVCLIADDSVVIAKGLGRCAESRGWQACIVHNGQDALRALTEQAAAGLLWDAVLGFGRRSIYKAHQHDANGRIFR